jgi:hypothetical protein
MYNILPFTDVHILVLISYLIALCTFIYRLKVCTVYYLGVTQVACGTDWGRGVLKTEVWWGKIKQ